jgi:predicted RNase H-like HicB family nuclease
MMSYEVEVPKLRSAPDCSHLQDRFSHSSFGGSPLEQLVVQLSDGGSGKRIGKHEEIGGYWAICPEVPGGNGQGETVEETKASLRDAIRLILEDRLEDVRRGLPTDAIQTVIVV